MANSNATQLAGLAGIADQASARASQISILEAFGPLASRSTTGSQMAGLAATSAGEDNVQTQVSQAAAMIAYATQEPAFSRQDAWTFVLDGHRFYVLPLGREGTMAYDVTTGEWSELQTDGFKGLNFSNGVMWGLRIMGGDVLYSNLYEMVPSQTLDEGWRPIKHVVTGGIPLRGRYSVGVSNFTLTASVNKLQLTGEPISLSFSDDNGVTWSPELSIDLTGVSTQDLIWNSLGSFSNPGRVFRVTDYAGPVRIDGANVVLSGASGADSGQDQE